MRFRKNLLGSRKNFLSVMFGLVETVYLHVSFRHFHKSTYPMSTWITDMHLRKSMHQRGSRICTYVKVCTNVKHGYAPT